MKYVTTCLIVLLYFGMGYANADPCNQPLKTIQSNDADFNRLQQENLERMALTCQQYEIYKVQESRNYLDQRIRNQQFGDY